MKKIGILGGISLASTIHYYKTITDLYYEKYHDYYYPEILINSLNFQYFTDLENQHRIEEYQSYILEGLENLKKAGADFVIMAANSPHSVLESIIDKIPLPIISIVESVAKEAKQKGLKRVLLTGILYTMQSDFYQKGFSKYGIEVVVPNDYEKQIIENIIFKELVINKVSNESKQQFLDIINHYDVDGVILGCTELPQLIGSEDTNKLLLNSLEIHCQSTLNYALDDK
ncbi:aspartate/glutamate racemase family protein [Tissierellaceae bacterium HCP3S3_D8]